MKRIFILYLFFTHCILINASEQPNGIITTVKKCTQRIIETGHDISTAVQLMRKKSPEIKKMCNCAALTCACASCYYCPQCCLCTSGCTLYTAAGCLIYKNYISTQPKTE